MFDMGNTHIKSYNHKYHQLNTPFAIFGKRGVLWLHVIY
jgi:hypothetical protein